MSLREFQVVFWVVLFLFVPQMVSADLRVIDETAIPFTGFLSKSEFDKRYPSEIKADRSKLDPGWYVIYQHHALNYTFGPILLEATGQDYLEELKKIVEAAAAQRPCIEDYRLELSYEPNPAMQGSGRESVGSSGGSPSSESNGDSGNGTTSESDASSIWDFFRGLVGWF